MERKVVLHKDRGRSSFYCTARRLGFRWLWARQRDGTVLALCCPAAACRSLKATRNSAARLQQQEEQRHPRQSRSGREKAER